ncbi:hypothetical protein [Flavobacterium gelatinilyticum]|uniref:hypothetical protein n=1 Tax=Flavobacterium gelatinilyticum TaxID=3003260 RepID=UPI0024810B26|nr:hypothetical protein [Flavobacterium gelatinilyticum]
METSKTTYSEKSSTCPYQTCLSTGDNNELVFIKKYNGDWGDWDETTENCTPDPVFVSTIA